MRKPLWMLLTVLALMVASNVRADDTTAYAIHFSLDPSDGIGPLPTAGSFVYDNTTNQFVSFKVDWDGFAFDLTSSANNPVVNSPAPPCPGTHGPEATLGMMTTCAAGYQWNGVGVYGFPCGSYFSNQVGFFFTAPFKMNIEAKTTVPPPLPDECINAGGSFFAKPTVTWRPPPTGLGRRQIIRIIAGPVRVPPGVPVQVNLGFVDVNGTAIGPQSTEMLTQDQTATLDLNADALQLRGRTLVRPVVTVVNPDGLPSIAAGSTPGVFIPEGTEVFDATTGVSRVLYPGDTAFAAHPTFAFQGLASGETMQLIVSAFPNTGCSATLGFTDINGNPVGSTKQINLQPGQSDSLELHAATLGLAPGQRAEIQPLVNSAMSSTAVSINSACQATAEVFDTLTGRTWMYQAGARQLPAGQ
jgi:hypothetical protein